MLKRRKKSYSDIQKKYDLLLEKYNELQNKVADQDSFATLKKYGTQILESEKTDFFLIDLNTKKVSLVISATTNLLKFEPNFLSDIEILFSNEDKNKLVAFIEKAATGTSSKFNSKIYLDKDLTKEQKKVEVFFLKESAKEGILLIKDYTELSKHQKELSKVKEKVEESDKLKTILLSNISHQIRTPLNSITGFSELLITDDLSRSKRKEYIDIIKRQSKRILNLIDDISEISKLETGSINISNTPCNLSLLFNELWLGVNQQRSESRKSIVDIELNIPQDDKNEIITDSGRLQQVVLNIVNYSLRYTQQGKVEFGYSYDEENAKIIFFVKDTSDGLSKEEQKVVFNRFMVIDNTENSKYEDPGLGLTIARETVKALGGKIWMESEPGKGNAFYFNIPLIKSDNITDTDISTEIEEEELYNWSNHVILIVDDEDVNAMFLDAVLQVTGVQLLYAKNGLQALELIKNINKIDLVLMDLKMPVMNGIKATYKIREINPTIPIIVQTALTDEKDIYDAEQAGCNDSITKPIEVKALLQLVNKYLSDENSNYPIIGASNESDS